MNTFISANNDGCKMIILKKDFGLAKVTLNLIPSNPSADGLDGMVAGRISLPELVEGLGKTRPDRFTPPCGAGMPVRRAKHQTRVYASAASRQISRYRRRLFPTKFALP
ncbi:MAG: hypothetical protein WC299_03660 [Kiritimatiellia bacterium]